MATGGDGDLSFYIFFSLVTDCTHLVRIKAIPSEDKNSMRGGPSYSNSIRRTRINC